MEQRRNDSFLTAKWIRTTSQEFGENLLTTQAIIGTFDVELPRVQLLSRIPTFHHPRPHNHTALSFLYPLFLRETRRLQTKAVSESEEDVVDPDHNFRADERNTQYPKRPQQRDPRSWYYQVQWKALEIYAQAIELVRWKYACRRSEDASASFSNFSPVKMGSTSATMQPVWLRQFELTLTRTSGDSFIDNSSRILKAVLLHNGKRLVSFSLHSGLEY